MLKKVLKKFVSFTLIFTIFTSPCMHVFAGNNTEIIEVNGNEFEVTEENDKITVVQDFDDKKIEVTYNKSTNSANIDYYCGYYFCSSEVLYLDSYNIYPYNVEQDVKCLINVLIDCNLIGTVDDYRFSH